MAFKTQERARPDRAILEIEIRKEEKESFSYLTIAISCFSFTVSNIFQNDYVFQIDNMFNNCLEAFSKKNTLNKTYKGK